MAQQFDPVLLRAVPVAPWATPEDPGPLSGYDFTFWAVSQHDAALSGIAVMECRRRFDEHLLDASGVKSYHDGRHRQIQATIANLTLRRFESLGPNDRRPQPWEMFCDELIRIFSQGHQGYLVRRELIWRCSHGRHRSLGMAVAAAAVLRYFGATVRVLAHRDRLCSCDQCGVLHDPRPAEGFFLLVDLVMGAQLAASTSRLVNEGIDLTDEVRDFVEDLIERADYA